MFEKVRKYIVDNNLIEQNDKVLIAFSGGPDSLSLSSVLVKLREEMNLTLYAAHINHNIRGKESDEDQSFVEKYCMENDIKLFVLSEDVEAIAKERKRTVEETAREIRYDFFDKIFKAENINKIALAHNKNDQAETVIHRFLRGSGISGLRGMKKIRDGKYIRPLLSTKRVEIEEYLKEEGLTLRIDSTNLTTDYTRNRIRLEVIPYIEKYFNSDVFSSMERLAESAALDDEYIYMMTDEALKNNLIISKKHKEVILKKEIFTSHKAIISRAIFRAIESLIDKKTDTEMRHIQKVIDLTRSQSGKRINLTNNIIVTNIYGDLLFSLDENKDENLHKDNDRIRFKLSDLKEAKEVFFNGYSVYLKVSDKKENTEKNVETFFLNISDKNKVYEKSELIVRNRLEGDRIKPLGMKGYKKLKSLFIDRKIPVTLRDTLPIIELDNGDIIYIHGGIINEDYKTDKNTEKYLMIRTKKLQ